MTRPLSVEDPRGGRRLPRSPWRIGAQRCAAHPAGGNGGAGRCAPHFRKKTPGATGHADVSGEDGRGRALRSEESPKIGVEACSPPESGEDGGLNGCGRGLAAKMGGSAVANALVPCSAAITRFRGGRSRADARVERLRGRGSASASVSPVGAALRPFLPRVAVLLSRAPACGCSSAAPRSPRSRRRRRPG